MNSTHMARMITKMLSGLFHSKLSIGILSQPEIYRFVVLLSKLLASNIKFSLALFDCTHLVNKFISYMAFVTIRVTCLELKM